MIRRAIILAGGDGTRLRPITLEIPKPLVPVQGTPIATWLVRLFARHGVEEITVIYPTKWKSQFETWAVGAQGIAPITLFEETKKMGTLGAIVHKMTHGDVPMFVTNGDELKGLDLNQLEAFHDEQRKQDAAYAATIALVRVPNPSEYGVAEMDETHIVRFHEKPAIPPSTLISSGLYVIEPSVLKEIDPSKRYLMFEQDLFPALAAQHRLGGCSLSGQWFDCGTPERWERAIHEWDGSRL